MAQKVLIDNPGLHLGRSEDMDNRFDYTSNVRSLTTNIARESLDSTTSGDGDRSFTLGLRTTEISAELYASDLSPLRETDGTAQMYGTTVMSLTGVVEDDPAPSINEVLRRTVFDANEIWVDVYQDNVAPNTAGTATNPRFSMVAVIDNFTPLGGQVGSLHMHNVKFMLAAGRKPTIQPA